MKRLFIVAATSLFAGPLAAQDTMVTYAVEGSFEDAAFAVESAILDRGLVIDYTAHVGDMLNRTGADVGSDIRIFEKADVYVFCSAVVSRKVMEVDPMNIAFCPYGVFVADRDNQVIVGYRTMPEGPMQEVQALLDAIAREAAE